MSDENRALIREQALALFAEKGYEAVGVQEIVDSIGITKPTLYHYFGSKKGLLAEIIATYGDELLSRVKIPSNSSCDLSLALHQVAEALFAFARRRTLFYRLYLALWFAPASSEAAQVARPYHTRLFDIIVALFDNAFREKEQQIESRRYAFTFLGLLHTDVGAFLNGAVELDEITCARVVHQFLHGISPQPDTID